MVCASLPAIRQLLVRAWPRAFLSSIHHSDDPQAKAGPWDSHTGPGRVTHTSGDGFIELQQTHGNESGEMPPEPPPKDAAFSVPLVKAKPSGSARLPS